jgi:hypothetical protein
MEPVARPTCARRWLAASLFAVFVLLPITAHATTYFTVPAVMKSFFPNSKKVTYKRITLTDADAADITKRLGVESIKREWVVYYGETDGRREGYAIVDDEKGMHDPIDYAVRFNDKGVIERVEIMVYREAYGEEIRSQRFRAQFGGKTGADVLTAGKDIDIVSGASISCKSMAVGVKRDALVVAAALKSRSL